MFTTKKELERGGICSGVGLLVYLILRKIGVAVALSHVLALLGLGISLWTAISIWCYPKEKKEADINYNNLWGQSAMTLLWAACVYLEFMG